MFNFKQETYDFEAAKEEQDREEFLCAIIFVFIVSFLIGCTITSAAIFFG